MITPKGSAIGPILLHGFGSESGGRVCTSTTPGTPQDVCGDRPGPSFLPW